MDVKNFTIAKCISLNSELILVLSFGLVSHPGPRPNKYFFWGEKSDRDILYLVFFIIYYFKTKLTFRSNLIRISDFFFNCFLFY